MVKLERKLWFRKSDKLFPAYTDDDRAKNPDNYVAVLGIEDVDDHKTHRLGNWSAPDVAEGEPIIGDDKNVIGHKAGVMTSYRKSAPRSPDEIAEIDREKWVDVDNARRWDFVETDVLLLRVLEDRLPAGVAKKLRDHRQAMRDIKDPAKNGGITDPTKIKLKRFEDD